MKNIIKSLFIFASALSLTACFSDDSTFGGNPVGEIEVQDLDASYTCMAYVGEHLKINPAMELGYAESDMKYTWMILDSKTGTITESGDTIQPIIIGTEKNLDYEVVAAPGSYQLRFVAEAKNGYAVYKYTTLNVQTAFSQGFYVLKETTDGNTELDELTADGNVSHDIYTSVLGAPLKGKPNTLSVVYYTYYINDDTSEMEPTNMISVATEDGDLSVNRVSDFRKVFDRTNICFDPLDDDETVTKYFYAPGMFYHNFLYTSKGLHVSDFLSSECTGQFGPADYPCAAPSRYIVWDGSNYGVGSFWSDEDCTFYGTGYDGFPDVMMDGMFDTSMTLGLTGYSCLACGLNSAAGAKGVYVMQDDGGKRWAYLHNCDMMFGAIFDKRVDLSGATHASKASNYAVCGQQAQYIYAVEGGKLWAVNYASDAISDIEMPLQGIGSGEEIVMVSNQFMKSIGTASFDYLIVGTQKGSTYKLYMYEMNGGVPKGEPVQTISGEGKVKSVRYIYPSPTKFSLNYGMIPYSSWD